MRKYLPIKVHNIHYGSGWWWGRYLFFFRIFAIVPIWVEMINTQTRYGKQLTHGNDKSWRRYYEYAR